MVPRFPLPSLHCWSTMVKSRMSRFWDGSTGSFGADYLINCYFIGLIHII